MVHCDKQNSVVTERWRIVMGKWDVIMRQETTVMGQGCIVIEQYGIVMDWEKTLVGQTAMMGQWDTDGTVEDYKEKRLRLS